MRFRTLWESGFIMAKDVAVAPSKAHARALKDADVKQLPLHLLRGLRLGLRRVAPLSTGYDARKNHKRPQTHPHKCLGGTYTCERLEVDVLTQQREVGLVSRQSEHDEVRIQPVDDVARVGLVAGLRALLPNVRHYLVLALSLLILAASNVGMWLRIADVAAAPRDELSEPEPELTLGQLDGKLGQLEGSIASLGVRTARCEALLEPLKEYKPDRSAPRPTNVTERSIGKARRST